MPKIIWNKRYNVNVKKLDGQHRRIAELVNSMNDRIKAKDDSKGIVEGFTDLIEFTEGHFKAEEALMKELGYPDYKRHKKEHKDLTNLLSDIKKQFRRQPKAFVDFDYDVAKAWLVIHNDRFSVHLIHSDKGFGAFLNKKGID